MRWRFFKAWIRRLARNPRFWILLLVIVLSAANIVFAGGEGASPTNESGGDGDGWPNPSPDPSP